ncbi:MAG: hypothetical protein R3A47_04155 [Polyangiales bacterium]
MDTQRKDYKVAYTIIDRQDGQKRFWLRIGAAFENRDGSINVKLDAVPTNGVIQLRAYEPHRRDSMQEVA